MADRYWVGGTGNWTDDDNHWATTSGGAAANGNVPTSADSVFFDANSNATAYTVTVDGTATCLDMTWALPGTSGVPTMAGSATLSVYGSLSLVSGMTWSYSSSAFVMAATSGTKTITTNGVRIDCTFNLGVAGGSGTFQLVDNITFGGSNRGLTLVAGTANAFDPNGKKVIMWGQTSNNGVQTISGALSFYDLEIKTTSIVANQVVVLASNITVTNTLLMTGESASVRAYLKSGTLGTQRTITNTGATMTWQYADFQDINLSTAYDASAITGLSGDCGGNTNITFTTAATQTSTGTDSFTWSTHGWTSRVPLPQDDVVVSNAFTTGRTVTLDVPRAGKSIDFSGATWSGTATALSRTVSTIVFGSFIRKTGMSDSGSNTITFEGRGSFNFSSAGLSGIHGITIQMVSGTLVFLDAFTTTGAISLNRGTLDAATNDVNVTIGLFTFSTSVAKVLNMGAGTWTITSTGNVWTTNNAGFTINASTSTLVISSTDGASVKNVTMGTSQTYNNITFSGKNIVLGFTTGVTFNTIALNNLGDTTGVSFPSAKTITCSDITTTASSGNVAKLIASTAGSAATISKASGTVSIDWCSIKDSAATGGASFYAGANSTDVSGNSGWTFTAPPAASLIKTVNGLAIASVKTVNGLAIASVKTVNGLTNV